MKLNGVSSHSSAESTSSNDSKEPVIYGPTTRKAWSEYCKSSMVKDSNGGTNSSNSSQSSSNETETNENDASDGKQKKRVGRPRKYEPGVSAVVKRAARKKVPGVNEPARRPGRPPKNSPRKQPKNGYEGLELLHEKTILSISNVDGQRTEPAPGCFDQKLESSRNLFSGMPSVIIRDSSVLTVNDDLNRLLETTRNEYLKFIAHMQEPEYKVSLTQQIEEQKVNMRLLFLIDF